MVSPDQAKHAADSLLEPAKQELAAKQEKLEKRMSFKDTYVDALVPAACGACIAITMLSFGYNSVIAFIFASGFGGLITSSWQKR